TGTRDDPAIDQVRPRHILGWRRGIDATDFDFTELRRLPERVRNELDLVLDRTAGRDQDRRGIDAVRVRHRPAMDVPVHGYPVGPSRAIHLGPRGKTKLRSGRLVGDP